MTKTDFLVELRKKLQALPPKDAEDRLKFYTEMIEDRIEDGLAEEDAVAAVGSIDEIAAQIIEDFSPDSKIQSTKTKRKFKTWEIVLLILGSPIWASLLIAAIAVVFSLYVLLWAINISLWAIFGGLAGSSLGCIAGGILFMIRGHIYSGIALIAGSMICAGFAIFSFIRCKDATNGAVRLTRFPFRKWFTRKEETQE